MDEFKVDFRDPIFSKEPYDRILVLMRRFDLTYNNAYNFAVSKGYLRRTEAKYLDFSKSYNRNNFTKLGLLYVRKYARSADAHLWRIAKQSKLNKIEDLEEDLNKVSIITPT